ncbi:MAG: PQQ-binding-like beta-propeller repeat protein [Ktedonobacteraceae bacterium]|nr:PQQ-binding-like beta-propeller repeat protein [Ktedonobacteraceae bacterium]
MFDVFFDLVLVAALCLLFSGVRLYSRRRLPLHPLLLYGICLSLLIFSACSRQQDGASAAPATPTSSVATTAASTPQATSSASVAWNDWFTYHHDNARTGYLPNMPDPKKLTKSWSTNLDGAVYAQPLMVKGHLIVVTEGDSLYSLDPKTGKVLWHTNVGQPVPQSTLPCGDIDPLGITGTPVYDPTTGLVFAVAEVTGPQHMLIGVDVNTGSVRVKRSVDVPGMDPVAHQQRAALLLANNRVYVAYGGLDGDCSDYRGTIVASQTSGTGDLLSYRVPTPREAGIWGTSGPASDSSGRIYASVGNGAETGGNWDHSDSVLRFSPTLQLQDGFAPQNWADENSSDTDLGSTGPLLLANDLAFIAGKSGNGYLLHANALGGIGGQIATAQVCNGKAMGGGAVVGSVVLVPCEEGIRHVSIGSGSSLTPGWQSPDLQLSPVVGGHTVYGMNSEGTLYALNLDTGAVRAKVALAHTPRFVSPTLSGDSVFVGTTNGVAAATIS